MQPKVSMVMPCYNKDRWIGGMLDSVIAQKWDNIELILVNNGSTDRTRDVIEAYMPKFHARGFETIVIDQENKGIAGAVYEGLKRISGEYFCTVDADDELDPEYVSAMAGWLSENPDDQWAVCDCLVVEDKGTRYSPTFPYEITWDRILEKWLLGEMNIFAWLYMIRTDYLRQCHMHESFYTGREGTQEAQIFFPLAQGGAKPIYLRRALYKHDLRSVLECASRRNDYKSTKNYCNGLLRSTLETIYRMPLNIYEKQTLTATASLGAAIRVIQNSYSFWQKNNCLTDAVDDIFEQAALFFENIEIINKALLYKNPQQFCTAVKDNVLGNIPNKTAPPGGRIIAWGALGKNAANLLPCLKDTSLEPDELWDAAGDDVNVKIPDAAKLSQEDTVLVMPTANKGILDELAKSHCGKVIEFHKIQSFTAFRIFPEFYDGSIRFNPAKTTI